MKIIVGSLLLILSIFTVFDVAEVFGNEFTNWVNNQNREIQRQMEIAERFANSQNPTPDRMERETYHVIKISSEDVKLRLVDKHDLNKIFNYNDTKMMEVLTNSTFGLNNENEGVNLCEQNIKKTNKVNVQELRTQIKIITEKELRD